MKKRFLILSAIVFAGTMYAREKKEITKTGYNFGPMPVVAYDADKGFQLGGILQIFNYGDGHNYPNYDSKIFVEASFFNKGSQLYQLRYDNKELIPGVRWCSAFRANIDKAYDFYGFNGYQSYYDYRRIEEGKSGESYSYTPYYRMQRNEFLLKTDFIGKITDNFCWEAGLFANYFKTGLIDKDNINRGKSEKEAFPEDAVTLLEVYRDAGIISESEFGGGFAGGLRLGLVYDTRDKEGAPSRGIWAEGHVALSPGFMSKNQYYRYSLTFRHYVPIVKNDALTFAYRLNYEGNFGNSAPYYALPYMTSIGEKQDLEGMGGYLTVRGIMRTRVLGLDMAAYNAEFRWRFARFNIGRQNIALALNLFSDGAMVTRGRELPSSFRQRENDTPHITFGAGFRFIMNENFIIAAEYGMPLTHLMKNSPLYNQDGTGSFYVNVGYLF